MSSEVEAGKAFLRHFSAKTEKQKSFFGNDLLSQEDVMV